MAGKITRQELSPGVRAELDAVDTKDTAVLNSAKSYADTKKTEAISSANAYADQTETDAKSYADQVEADAKSYADTKKAEAIASSNGYTDTAVSSKFLKGQLSVTNSSWVASGNATFPYKKGVAISGVTTSDTPSLAFTAATIGIARDADMAYVETYGGGIILYAGKVPSGTVTFDYLITKG